MAVKERRSRSDCASARLCALEDTAVRKFARRFLRRATPLRSRRQHWDCRSVRREPQHWVSSIPRGLSSSPSGRTRCVAHRSVRAHWTLSTGSGRARIFIIPKLWFWGGRFSQAAHFPIRGFGDSFAFRLLRSPLAARVRGGVASVGPCSWGSCGASLQAYGCAGKSLAGAGAAPPASAFGWLVGWSPPLLPPGWLVGWSVVSWPPSFPVVRQRLFGAPPLWRGCQAGARRAGVLLALRTPGALLGAPWRQALVQSPARLALPTRPPCGVQCAGRRGLEHSSGSLELSVRPHSLRCPSVGASALDTQHWKRPSENLHHP